MKQWLPKDMQKQCSNPECQHSKMWHSLTSQFYTPTMSGCLFNNCKCRLFVESEINE